MTPSQLFARIEALGTVEAKYLDKIRKQIDNPKRVVKTKAMVRYLLEKKQVTKDQAKALLAPVTEDEMQVVQPVENDFDSAALLGADDLRTDLPVDPEPAPTQPAAVEPVEVEPIEVEPVEVEPVAVEPIEVEPVMPADATVMDEGQFEPPAVDVVDVQPVQQNVIDDAGFGDDSMSYGDQAASAKPDKPVATFKGKRDQKDQFKTKWLFIGFMLLSLVVLGVALLYFVVFGQGAEAMIKAANESYDKNNWADATNKIEEVIEKHPGHKEIPTMRAKLVHSILRSKFQAKSYDEMLKQADIKLAKLAEEKDNKMSKIRDDLGVILPRGLDEIAQKSADAIVTGSIDEISQMEAELEKITVHKKVIDNPVYVPGSIKKSQIVADVYSRIDNNMRLITGLIAKEKDYEAALVDIESLREASKTDDAFNAYRKLTRNHPDLAARKPLSELMLTISKKESELVKAITVDLKPQSSWRPSIIANSVVLSSPSGRTIASLEGEVVPVVADGAAYGINAGNGTVVWRHFVGQETVMMPIQLEARSLIVDQKNHDLICVETETGELAWRIEFGEPIRPPAIGPNEEMLIVSTESGKVIELDAASGAVQKAAQLPQATGPTALIGVREPVIYQVGRYSNIYALDRQTYECLEVYSLGHYQGAVSVPPIQWSGYILVVVNGGDFCELHVFKPQKNGIELKRIQVIPRVLDGPATMPFIKAGSSYLLVGDNNQINLLGIDPTNEGSPIESQTKQLLGDADGARPYVSAVGTNVWLASDGIVHARIRRSQGTVTQDAAIQAGDQFLMAAEKLDDYIFHVRRRNGSGMLSASLADAKKLTPVWRTDFGGELAGSPLQTGNSLTAISNQGDVFSIDAQAMQVGRSSEPIRSSEVIQNLRFNSVLRFGDGLAAIGPRGTEDFLYFEDGSLKLTQLAPPANKPACRPLKLGDQLIIASTTGYVARTNPKNGRMIGTPFQTAITPESIVNWLSPVKISDDKIAIAIGESATEPNKLFVLSTQDARKISLISELESEFPFKGELSVANGQVVAVSAGKNGDTLATFGGDPLTQTAQNNLNAAVVGGPWKVGDNFLVKLDNDKLSLIDSDLQARWSAGFPNVQMAADPEVVDGQIMLCFKSGQVMFLNPNDGQIERRFDVGQPIVNRPLMTDSQMIFSGSDGTVHIVNLADIH